MNKDEIKEQLSTVDENDFDQRLLLHGRLISAIKQEIKDEKDYTNKAKLNLELHTELIEHKKLIDSYQKNDDTIPLPKRVGLKVKEISNVIQTFFHKKDYLSKVKSALAGSAISSVFAAGISLGIAALSGGIGLPALAEIVPTTCYITLSGLIRVFADKNTMEKAYDSIENKDAISKANSKFFQENIVQNKQLIDAVNRKKNANSLVEKIAAEEQLVELFKKVVENSPSEDIKVNLQYQLIDYMNELKEDYVRLKDAYIKDKVSMSKDEYTSMEKKMSKLDGSIISKKYFLGDAVKDAAKNTGLSIAVMIAARALLGKAFPSLRFGGIKDLTTSGAIIAFANLMNIPYYKDTLSVKPTSYGGSTMNVEDRDKFEEALRSKKSAMAV